MADTIPDIKVSGADWIDLYAATDIAVGTPVSILNKSSHSLLLQETATKPNAENNDGRVCWPSTREGSEVIVYNIPTGLWGKCEADDYTALINIQEV